MNIILEGPDAVGKTTLAEKLSTYTNMNIVHFPSATAQEHLDALNKGNTIFDRFHIGELVYPKIYNREPKLDFDEANKKIMKSIVNNGDIIVIFITSNLDILRERLIERKEFNYLDEIEQQNILFTKYAWCFDAWEYDNLYIVDIAEKDAYDKLWNWLKLRLEINEDINDAYRNVCKDLLEKGELVKGGNTTRGDYYELINYMFSIKDISNEYVSLETRNTSYSYLIGELLWYWQGRNDLKFIRHFSKFWDKISDDGETSNSAYGYILKKKHGFDQIETIIDLLDKDPTSRRAIINFNVPNKNVSSTKDEICTICLNFRIKNNKLNCTCVMRSNDVIFGLTYDLSYFILLQKYIADRLNVGYGSYTHIAFSMHVYERDFNLVKSIAYGSLSEKDVKLNLNKLLKDESTVKKYIDYIDNSWTSRDDFDNILREDGIIE